MSATLSILHFNIGTNEKMRNDDEEMSRGAAADSNSIKAKTFFSRKKYW